MRHQAIRLALACLVVVSDLVAGVVRKPDTPWPAPHYRMLRRVRWRNFPVDTSDAFGAQRAQVLGEKRRTLIRSLEKLVRDTRDADRLLEAKLRLGRLYVEDYYARLAEPRPSRERAMASASKARAIYAQLLKALPRHPRGDEMLYFYGLVTTDIGKADEGMGYYRRILDQYPSSRFAGDALVALGDHFFERNQLGTADGYYTRLIASRDASLLPYALYKKAWCAYNQGASAEALRQFKLAVEEQKKSEIATVNIRNEALRDMAPAFADLKLVDEAVDYYEPFGDPSRRVALETIAALYLDRGEHDKSIRISETLLGLDAKHPRAPQYELNVVKALDLANRKRDMVDRLFDRIPRYLEGSSWYSANDDRRALVTDTTASFEKTARDYAVGFHAEAQRTNDEAAYLLARTSYERYLAIFPQTAQAPHLRFSLAEILYRAKEFALAADHFHETYRALRKGLVAQKAIWSSLASLDQQMSVERKKPGVARLGSKSLPKLGEAADAKLEEIPFEDTEKKFLDYSGEFLAALPGATEVPDVLYETGYLYYSHHSFDHALDLFRRVTRSYPQHATFESAAHLTLDILNRKADYVALVAECKALLAKPGRPVFRAEVASILRHGQLKRIARIEAKGDYRAAAGAYLEYCSAYGPQDEALWEKALYNAGVNFGRAESYAASLDAREKFLARFPKSALAPDAQLALAKTAELLGDFDRAGSAFEAYAEARPRDAETPEALRLAGLYLWGAGQATRAEKVMIRGMERYPKLAPQLERDLLDFYESSGAPEKAIAFHRAKLARPGVGAREQIERMTAIADLATGQAATAKWLRKAAAVARDNASALKRDARGAELLARLTFSTAEETDRRFQHASLGRSARALPARLKHMLAALKELDTAYTRIAPLGGTWGLGSYYRRAAAYRRFAHEITIAPVPTSLDAKALEIYHAEVMKTLVTPMREKALALATECLRNAESVGIYSEWTPRCAEIAQELAPERFPKVHTFYLPAVQTAAWVPPRSEAQLRAGDTGACAFPCDTSLLYQASAGDGAMSYQIAAAARKLVVERAVASNAPSDPARETFAHLNYLRMASPEKAVAPIRKAILGAPKSTALHNLLGLAYLERKQLAAAKVTWLSLLARGHKEPGILNNLGVLAVVEGHEARALEWFRIAAAVEGSREARVNLAFLALKYRNPVEAKRLFSEALDISKSDPTAAAGLLVAALQGGDVASQKEKLEELVGRFSDDPYVRLSVAHFLVDVEKEPEAARKLLMDYLEKQQSQDDPQLQRALREAKPFLLGGELVGRVD